MSWKQEPRICACGCGQPTIGGARFVTGHDRRLEVAILNEVGGVEKLRDIVEKAIGRRIRYVPDHDLVQAHPVIAEAVKRNLSLTMQVNPGGRHRIFSNPREGSLWINPQHDKFILHTNGRVATKLDGPIQLKHGTYDRISVIDGGRIWDLENAGDVGEIIDLLGGSIGALD